MHKPSADGHLTADHATCKKCGVTQKKDNLTPYIAAPYIPAPREGDLWDDHMRKTGQPTGKFTRDPPIVHAPETEESKLKREEAGYYCKDDDVCVQRRIDAAVQADRARVLEETQELASRMPKLKLTMGGIGRDKPKPPPVPRKLAEKMAQHLTAVADSYNIKHPPALKKLNKLVKVKRKKGRTK